MWRMGVPVATPVGAKDYRAAIAALVRPEGRRTTFEHEVRMLLGARFVRATNSGRSA